MVVSVPYYRKALKMRSFIATQILEEGGLMYSEFPDSENYFLETLLGFYFYKRLEVLVSAEKLEEISFDKPKLLQFGLAFMRAKRGAAGYAAVIGGAGKVVRIETPTGSL